MATNGQINTNTLYDSYFWVKWSQSGDQDIANNRTLIAWSCGVYCGHTFYQNAIKMSPVSINGTEVYSGGTYSNFAHDNYTLASGSMWIDHNSDGTKTFNVSSFTGWLYSNYNYSSGGGKFELSTIPREATITSASDFTDNGDPSITFSNPAGFPIYYVWLEPNPPGNHRCIRYGIPDTGSYTWELTNAERDELRKCCTGQSCTIRIGICYYVGETIQHHCIDRTFSVEETENTRPTVNLSVTINNELLPSKFEGLWVQGKSKANVSATADGKYGAQIMSYWANVDGKGYIYLPFTSDVILHGGLVDIKASAKDNREFIGSASQQINVLEYSKPLVIPLSSENAVLCYRSNALGEKDGKGTSVWAKAQKSFYSISGMNSCYLEYRSKLITAQWDDKNHPWLPLYPQGDSMDEYNDFIPGYFDATKAYTIQIRAVDEIGEQDVKTFEIPTEDVALHLGKGGKNVSVGTYCDYSEEHTFRSAWKAIFDDEVVIQGMTLKDYILSVINGGG